MCEITTLRQRFNNLFNLFWSFSNSTQEAFEDENKGELWNRVRPPPVSFWTSLQFETLTWCGKLAFASPRHAQTFIHQSVPSHIPPLRLSLSVTSFSTPISLSPPRPAFSISPPVSLSPPPQSPLSQHLSVGLHHLLSWIHLRHSLRATTSDLLKDLGGDGFCNAPSSIKPGMWSVEERKGNWLGWSNRESGSYRVEGWMALRKWAWRKCKREEKCSRVRKTGCREWLCSNMSPSVCALEIWYIVNKQKSFTMYMHLFPTIRAMAQR